MSRFLNLIKKLLGAFRAIRAALHESRIRHKLATSPDGLVADTIGGAHAGANLYSLNETCKANQVDPYQYLAALFRALPLATTADDYEALLPWRLAPAAT